MRTNRCTIRLQDCVKMDIASILESSNFTLDSTFLWSNHTPEVSPFEHAIQNMNTFVIPVVVFVGIAGNILTLVVFQGTYLRQTTLSVYLTALALSDLCCLVTIFIVWLEVVKVDAFHTSGVCEITVYVTYVGSFLSMWYVVSFTVERYIAICYPLKRPQMCTASRAKVVTSSLAVFAMLAYGCTLWTYRVTSSGASKMCIPTAEYTHVSLLIASVDTIFALFIPFCVILGMNLTIVHKIARFYSTRNRRIPSFDERCRLNVRDNNNTSSLATRAQLQMTKVLLIVSSLFLMINLPSCIIRLRILIVSLTGDIMSTSPQEFMWQSVFQIVYYTNFAVNVFLYGVCCRKFRKALKRLVWQGKYHFTTCGEKHVCMRRHSSPVRANEMY